MSGAVAGLGQSSGCGRTELDGSGWRDPVGKGPKGKRGRHNCGVPTMGVTLAGSGSCPESDAEGIDDCD